MSYEIGTKVRVKMTARVTRTSRTDPELSATTKVTETSGAGSHFLFLGSDSVTGSKEPGDTVQVEFDARVTGAYEKGPLITTQVTELDNGAVHYVFLGSGCATVIEDEPEPEPEEIKRMAYAIGTKIRVDITAAVENPARSGANFTTGVQQTENGPWRHYLFLASGLVTGDKSPGGTVRARFDAVITGTFKEGQSITTQVTELVDGSTDDGCIHYLYLDSNAVTVLDDEKPAEPAPQRQGEKSPVGKFVTGAKIRVNLSGTVGERPYPDLIATNKVEAGDATHYLYLSSPSVTGGSYGTSNVGDKVTAAFDAVVIGPYEEGPLVTTKVRELGKGGEASGYSHYVYLGSDSVTVIEDEKPAEPEPAAVSVTVKDVGEIKPDARVKDVGGERITPAAREIESADILKRIAELEDAARPVTGYRIIRPRGGNQLVGEYPFPTVTAAREYLDERDFNLERFVIEPVAVKLSLGDEEELEQLRKLNEAGRNQFGFERWITFSVLLRSDDYCDSGWARDQAAEKLGVSNYRLDEWPLAGINWTAAATELLEADYLPVDFNGVKFWGEYTG